MNNKDGVTDDAKRTNGGVGVGLNVVVEKCWTCTAEVGVWGNGVGDTVWGISGAGVTARGKGGPTGAKGGPTGARVGPTGAREGPTGARVGPTGARGAGSSGPRAAGWGLSLNPYTFFLCQML